MNNNVTMQLANMHDAFMNANLQFNRIESSPLESEPDRFMISDRGRFERAWLAFLYVLVEAWLSTNMTEVRERIRALVPDCLLDEIIQEGQRGGAIEKLRQVRHYMCHRDEREYWNVGRTAVAGNLDYNIRLHQEFARVLLEAMRRHAS